MWPNWAKAITLPGAISAKKWTLGSHSILWLECYLKLQKAKKSSKCRALSETADKPWDFEIDFEANSSVQHFFSSPVFLDVLQISKLCSLNQLAASLWLSEIGQVRRDSGASLIPAPQSCGLLRVWPELHPILRSSSWVCNVDAFVSLCSCGCKEEICDGTTLQLLLAAWFKQRSRVHQRGTAFLATEVEIWGLWTCLGAERRIFHRFV